MELYLAAKLEQERGTVKGIATAARDAVQAVANDQARAFDLLRDVHRTLEGVVTRQHEHLAFTTASPRQYA